MPRGSSAPVSFGVMLAFACVLGICFAIHGVRLNALADRLRILEQLHRVERTAPTRVYLTASRLERPRAT